MGSNLTWNDVINSTKDPLTPEVAEQFIKCILNKESSRKITLPDDRPANDNPSFDIENSLTKESVLLTKHIIDKIKENLGNLDELPILTPELLEEKGFNSKNFTPTKEQLTKLFSLSTDDLLNLNTNNSHENIKPILDRIFEMTDLFSDHVGSRSIFNNEHAEKKYQSRIYLNTPTSEIGTEFLSEFIKKCLDKGVPYEMKALDKLDSSIGKDKTIIYSHSDYTLDHIEILEELSKEHPEWIKDFGTPIHTGGSPEINSAPWYSIGYNPTDRKNGNRMTITYNDFIDVSGNIGLGSAICQSLSPNIIEELRNLYNNQFGKNIPPDHWKNMITQLSELSSTTKGFLSSYNLASGDYKISENVFTEFLVSDNVLNLKENFDKIFPENSSARENFINRFIKQTEKAVNRAQPDKSLSEIYLSAEMCNAYDKEEKTVIKAKEEIISHHKEETPGKKSKEFRNPGDLPEYTSHGTYHHSKGFRRPTSFDLAP